MTVSFHQHGKDFFPGTGAIDNTGVDLGKEHSLNVPLKPGLDDESFIQLFKPILGKVMQVYDPGAIVLQCGADSLSGDRLGSFNLTIKGHAECLKYLRSFNVPLMVLGGGGYTIKNVARCWCYETAVAVGAEIDDMLPLNPFSNYFGPNLHDLYIKDDDPPVNENTAKDLENLRNKLLEQLSKVTHTPSVQFQERPPLLEFSEEGEQTMDKRRKSIMSGKYDSDEEEFEEGLRQSFNARDKEREGTSASGLITYTRKK